MKSEAKAIILGIISIMLTLLAIVSEEYRVMIISLSALVVAIYLSYERDSRVETNSNQIKKLNENLNIHKELIEIRANIDLLKRKVFKR